MAHVIFVQLPELGHINPTIKIARRLKRHGHRVSYIGLSDFAEYVTSHGLEFISILERVCPKGFLADNAGARFSLIDLLNKLRSAGASEIETILKRAQPDLLIVDVELLGMVSLARKIGIPCALVSTNLVSAKLIADNDARKLGLPVLILCPKEFDFPNSGGQAGHYFIEASVELERIEPYSFPFDKLHGTKPLIYCSLGSRCHDFKETRHFFQTVIQVIRERADCQLVLATSRFQLDPSDINDLPQNVFLVSWAPQLAVLKRASIVITHGGLGTIKECIFAGVPMIVCTVTKDQPENAARITYHGLGVCSEIGQVSIPRLHSFIETIQQDPSFRIRVESMGKRFRAVESSGRGAEIVERILEWLSNNGPMPYEPYTGARSKEFHHFLSPNGRN